MHIARDLMTADPVSVRATDTVAQAVQILQELEIRHLPVVNSGGELIGMLSDRDLRSLALPVVVDREKVATLRTALESEVASLMSGDVISVGMEADGSDVVELMLEHRIGAVPVVDADNRLAGIVSYVDVLRELRLDD
jgi:acetoin utilization protein AcuB